MFEGDQLRLFSVHGKPGIQLQRMLLDTLGTGPSFNWRQLWEVQKGQVQGAAQASGPVFD